MIRRNFLRNFIVFIFAFIMGYKIKKEGGILVLEQVTSTLDNNETRLTDELMNLKKQSVDTANKVAVLSNVEINVLSYKAEKNNWVDAINFAISVAQQSIKKNCKPTLRFPLQPNGYRVTKTITVPNNINVIMDSPIVYAGKKGSVALIIGNPTDKIANSEVKLKLQAVREMTSDWKSESDIGILLINTNSSNIEVIQTKGFTIGCRFLGLGQGFSYNSVKLGTFYNCKVQCELTNIGFEGKPGWCNDNNFFGGRLSNASDIYRNMSRYGVRITSLDGSYKTNNNNVFWKTCFELQSPKGLGLEALPILIEHGNQNSFLKARDEGNTTFFARILNDSTENEFNVGYSASNNINIDDQSDYPASVATNSRTSVLEKANKLIFSSGNLIDKICNFDTTRKNIAGIMLCSSSNSSYSVAQSEISSDGDYITLSPTRAIGIRVNTNKTKRFVLKRDVLDSNSGRPAIRCYDSEMNILTGEKPSYVKGTITRKPSYWNDAFGGIYIQGSDKPGDFYFEVHQSVQFIDVLCQGGTLKSFSVFTLDNETATAFNPDAGHWGDKNLAIMPPTNGKGIKGKKIYNYNPVPGGYEGWICVEDGEPGTWKGFGLIEN
ncbi:hypothetical protein JMN23_27095 [Bacillus sp. RHFB]|nr:hypothetical protein [Bacillus sp. RHFB]